DQGIGKASGQFDQFAIGQFRSNVGFDGDVARIGDALFEGGEKIHVHWLIPSVPGGSFRSTPGLEQDGLRFRPLVAPTPAAGLYTRKEVLKRGIESRGLLKIDGVARLCK